MNHKLAEFVAAIPAKYKLKRWEKKHKLIKAPKGIVPKSNLAHPKQRFSIPLGQWLVGPLKELTHAYLSGSA